jgi:hypothetical protein
MENNTEWYRKWCNNPNSPSPAEKIKPNIYQKPTKNCVGWGVDWSLSYTPVNIDSENKKATHSEGDKVSIGLWENYSAPAGEQRESRSKATTASGWKINTELFFFCPAKKEEEEEEDKTVERGMSTGI